MSKFFGFGLMIVGILVLASSASADDYWEACHRAVDCVAGDPPSVIHMVYGIFVGLILMVIGFFAVTSEYGE